MSNTLEHDEMLIALAGKARQIEAHRDEAETRAKVREARLLGELLPRVRALHRYFGKLKSHLDVVQPQVSATYYLPGFGRLCDLEQGEYAVYTPDLDKKKVSRFAFQYALRRPGETIEVRIADPAGVAPFKENLFSYGMRFKILDGRGGGRIFVIDRHVPVSFSFCIDEEKTGIRLTMRNVKRLGAVVNTLTAEQVTSELTAEMAKVVLGEPNDLDELLGNELSKTTRFQIRRALLRELRSREQASGDG